MYLHCRHCPPNHWGTWHLLLRRGHFPCGTIVDYAQTGIWGAPIEWRDCFQGIQIDLILKRIDHPFLEALLWKNGAHLGQCTASHCQCMDTACFFFSKNKWDDQQGGLVFAVRKNCSAGHVFQGRWFSIWFDH
jgi:hypothetical protein